MTRLAINVLGEFQVFVEGTPISAFESDKTRALLVYLAVESGRSHRRGSLAGLLWPDCPEQAARHNLSQALFNLRLAVGDHTARPPFFLINRQEIQINRESDYSLDLDQFNAYYSASGNDQGGENADYSYHLQQLEEMVRIYRGEFLQQFYVEDSAEYEDWILVQREALHLQVINALTILANEYERLGDFQTAHRYALQQLALDPWREEAHYQIMRLLALDGQRSAALAQYESCRKVLADELGVKPSPKTQDLYEQLRSDTFNLKAEQQPPASSPPIHNLPIPMTPFIGREQELAELALMIIDPECRCIAFSGPGGIGKTRLALQAAEVHRDRFAHGCAFISVASVGSVVEVIPAIANGISFTFSGTVDPKIQLLNYLREKQMLLIVDNVEHLLVEDHQQGAITDLLIEIIHDAARVKLLVTSRESLNLQEVCSFEVQGLAVPQLEQIDGSGEYGAVSLFVQRARRACPGFELNADNQAGVLQLCRLVEGMPLAIELAAVWVRILTPAEIVHEIETSLDFLNAHLSDLPERHRSIRAVLDHSWQMLTDEERHVLRQMSVFRGGFTREAAKAVAGAGLVVLSTLMSKSLLRRTSEGRYSLHELVHQYIADRLAEVPEQEGEVRERYSAYYTDYVANLESKFKGPEQLHARAALDADIDNIRAGWKMAVRLGHLTAVRKPIRAFWCFYDTRGWYQEAESIFTWASEQIDAVLRSTNDADGYASALCDYLHAMVGWFYLRRGKIEAADTLLQSSLASLRSFGTGVELTDALYYAGAAAWMSGDYSRARAHFLEELSAAEQIGSEWDIGQASIGMGLLTQSTGEYEEAQQHWLRALSMYRKIGDQRGTAFALNFSSILKRILGANNEAQACLRECLALSESIGDRLVYGMALSQLGLVTQALGDHTQAVGFLNKSIGLLRELDEFWSLLHAYLGLGVATFSIEDYAASRAAYREALQMAWERQALPEVLEAMAGIARWSITQGAIEQALRSTLFILSHQAATQPTKEDALQMRAELESRLSSEEIEAVQKRVGTDSLEKVIQELLKPS